MKESVLMHCCCAPCTTSSVEQVIEAGYKPVFFYSNDNIYPREEFEKRLTNMRFLADKYEIPLYIKEYDNLQWEDYIKGNEADKEGGARCSKCFEYSLMATKQMADKLNIHYITTTLTVSPYKNSKLIFDIGSKIEGFLPFNFKKKNGYQRSIILSRELDLYRQDYCGCRFSLEFRNEKKKN